MKQFYFARALSVFIAAALSICATVASQAAVIYIGSGAQRSASATFTDLGGGNLQVSLVNTYAGDTEDQSHVLTALFFSGLDGLTSVSAILPPGSSVWNNQGSVPSGGLNVGGEWAYLDGLAGTPGGGSAGISSAGLNWFGVGNFNGPNIDAPGNGALNGSGFGILSTGYAGLALDGLAGRYFIYNSVDFVLSGFDGNLNDISNVVFQYGTATTEPSFGGTLVPEPNFGLGILLLPFLRSVLLRKSRKV